MDDPLGAFCRHDEVLIEGKNTGELAALTFGVKDVFDLSGYKTCAGNPDWLRTHPPPATTAACVRWLLDAGASVMGKTQTDELTYSLNGENVHYGTPVNPRARERIPGGSSSGSAVAVAGDLVDFAIGTDCGGSVRLPASYCGIFGMRPTHGRISLDGVMPLAGSFDTVGWFARNAEILKRVGRVLLGDENRQKGLNRLLLAADAFALVGDAVTRALQPGIGLVAAAVGRPEPLTVCPEGLANWMPIFRVLQGAEIWVNHGAWIEETRPSFGPGIRERFEWTSSVDAKEVAGARGMREQVRQRLDTLLGDDGLLCLPTTPGIAPLRNMPAAELEVFRGRAFSLLCIAGLARLPQISLPLGMLEGCPLGLSLIGPHGSDEHLLEIATRIKR